METRGLVCIKQNNELYGISNQFDSYYIGGLGFDLVKKIKQFISCEDELNFFKQNLKTFEWTTDPGKISLSINTEDIVEIIASNRVLGLVSPNDNVRKIFEEDLKTIYNDSNFINDNLFCEWTYIIDLDQDQFIIKNPLIRARNVQYYPPFKLWAMRHEKLLKMNIGPYNEIKFPLLDLDYETILESVKKIQDV